MNAINGKHGEFRQPNQWEDFSQKRTLEASGEILDAQAVPLPERAQERQHLEEHLQAVERAVQLRSLVDGHLETKAFVRILDEVPDEVPILGRQLQHMLFQTVQVTVENELFAMPPFEPAERVEVDHLPPLYRSEFLPDPVETGAGLRIGHPVKTAIYGVTLACPGRAQPAGLVVHLKYLGIVAVHPGVASCCEAGNAGADDDD